MYWYTTPLNRGVFRVKNGSARRKAESAYEAAEMRIKEQVTAANSADPYEILHVEDVSDRCETGKKHESLSLLRQLEQGWMHGKQKRMGMWVPSKNSASEWFHDPAKLSVDNVVGIGKQLINEWRHGVARPNAYLMREEQQACHDMIVEHFRNGGDKFLMNAKMRFGKTFVTLQTLKTLGVKRALVLTYKPAVDASWREDLETHIDFDGWTYTSAKDHSTVNPIQLDGSADVEVLFGSFQDANEFSKPKWKHAMQYHYDVVVIDEMHYGSATERAKETLRNLSYDKILYVSGTPLKALMSGEFLEDEVYTWSYADEQRKRQAEKETDWESEIYRWLPEMQFMTFEVCEEAKQQTRYYTDEEGFTMTKMFGSEDGETFIDQASVKLFVDQMFGRNVKKSQSPIRSCAVDHMLFVMPPNVKSATAFSKLLEKSVGDQYKVINVSGDNVRSLQTVKDLILANEKTITVTCGRFNTGVTVPEWDMVCMLDDTRAPETYFQTIFRCQSPDSKRGKELCTVVDFNPMRCLEMIYEYADFTAKKGQSTQAAVREFLDFAPVLDHTGNAPKQIDVNDVLNFMSETGSYYERFGSSAMLNWSLLDSVKNKFFGIDPDLPGMKKTQPAGFNDLERGKNFKAMEGKTKAEINEERKAEKEMRMRVLTMLRKLPTYLFLEDKKIDSIDDIMYTNNVELFQETVGLSIKDFNELCSGFIKTERLNRCIMAYNQIEQM
jgi:superfamily II DNA or RNA helicase